MAAVVFLPENADASARLAVPAPLAPPIPPSSGARSGHASSAVAAAGSLQSPGSDPVRIQIPALGIISRIIKLGVDENGSMKLPPSAYPVGWYDRGPTPGQQGPAVLAGHVDWAGTRGAFYGLRELRRGDTIVVDRADGTPAIFRVDRVEEHHKDRFPTSEVYGETDQAALRLITCGGAFDEDAGEYRDNVIVFASLAAAR